MLVLLVSLDSTIFTLATKLLQNISIKQNSAKSKIPTNSFAISQTPELLFSKLRKTPKSFNKISNQLNVIISVY